MLSLRSGMEYFARIVAGATLLTTSFLGQWLHHLEHDVCGHECSLSTHSCLPTHTYNHDPEHSVSTSQQVVHETPAHDHDTPAVPHDHHTCSICYVIGQAVQQAREAARRTECRNHHGGGAQFCRGDGSVHFVSKNIDGGIYRSRATIQGGEVSGEF